MTYQEFVYEHDLDLIYDLIEQHTRFHKEDGRTTVNEYPEMDARKFFA
ncbi:hypothetical protein NHG28_04870 [Aerococcaceae bacterium NML201209]|nr:hypothetical protein [Aerococcaceae bacterium NML201209]